ncbi:MAG: hypothetical protein RL757_2963 [Bacteroidota bacterium]|jgi:hypothetical protein
MVLFFSKKSLQNAEYTGGGAFFGYFLEKYFFMTIDILATL